MGETTMSTSHKCQQNEGSCVRKTMFSCTGRLHTWIVRFYFQKLSLWADPEVLAWEFTFRNCCQFFKISSHYIRENCTWRNTFWLRSFFSWTPNSLLWVSHKHSYMNFIAKSFLIGWKHWLHTSAVMDGSRVQTLMYPGITKGLGFKHRGVQGIAKRSWVQTPWSTSKWSICRVFANEPNLALK